MDYYMYAVCWYLHGTNVLVLYSGPVYEWEPKESWPYTAPKPIVLKIGGGPTS